MTGDTGDDPAHPSDGERESVGEVRCPHCGSAETRLERRKGTSLCRRMFYCRACSQPFEDFGSPASPDTDA